MLGCVAMRFKVRHATLARHVREEAPFSGFKLVLATWDSMKLSKDLHMMACLT
jgi:hypothetical protein